MTDEVTSFPLMWPTGWKRAARREREQQSDRIGELAEAIDDLKLRMQLAQQVKAFTSFAQFEMLARLAGDLGRQCGGWQKRRKDKGQNASASVPGQRPSILVFAVKLMYAHTQQNILQARTRDVSRFEESSPANLSVMAADEVSLPQPERQGLSALRRSRHSRVRAMARVRKLPCGHGRTAGRDAARSQGERRELRAIQLPLDHEEAEFPQSAPLRHAHGRRCHTLRSGVGRADGTAGGHRQRAPEARVVGTEGGQDTTRRPLFPIAPALRPLSAGIDFLGYAIYPRFTVVRRRVIRHARERLDSWERAHVRRTEIVATPEQLRELRSVCASYAGRFSHANSYRLRQRIRARYPWLRAALRHPRFDQRAEARPMVLSRGSR